MSKLTIQKSLSSSKSLACKILLELETTLRTGSFLNTIAGLCEEIVDLNKSIKLREQVLEEIE